MIRISIDDTYPMFASLPIDSLKKVSVGIGPTGMNMVYLLYQAYALNSETIGDMGVNQTTAMVSHRRPLLFTRESFGVFGNVTITDYSAGRLAALLADYVTRGVLKVTDTDTSTDLNPAQILTFVP